MKLTKIAFFLILLVWINNSYAADWRKGSVYFNDESFLNCEIKMGNQAEINVFYKNENVTLPYKVIKSIEMLFVKKGENKHPISTLKIELINGNAIEIEKDTYGLPFCYMNPNAINFFLTKRANPLTGNIEEKSYNWLGHNSYSKYTEETKGEKLFL